MIVTNKQGQALGRKGAESRTRLLEAARILVETVPVDKLTASAIARAAKLASQTFYLYFADVDEMLLCLSHEAARGVADVVAELDRPWPADTLGEQAGRFIAAFYRYWDRNRTILNIRNFRADSGQDAFAAVRNDSTLPIVRKLGERIHAANEAAGLEERDAVARAVIIISAIERMASRYAEIHPADSLISGADLRRAEADILMLLLSPSGR